MKRYLPPLMNSLLAVGISVFGSTAAFGAGPGRLAPAAAEQPQAPEESTKPGGGGMIGLVVDALKDVSIKPEQRSAIDALLDEARVRHEPLVEAHRALMMTLADQIQAGHVDRAALKGPLHEIAESWECVRTGDLAALQALHDVLDARQRAQFADALEKRVDAAIEAHRSGALVERLAKELDLTEKQKDEFRKAMCAHEVKNDMDALMAAKRERIAKVLDAFKSDEFDATKYAPTEDARAQAKTSVKMMLDFAESILPVLEPEQRAKLADLVRAHAAAKAGGKEYPPAKEPTRGAPMKAPHAKAPVPLHPVVGQGASEEEEEEDNVGSGEQEIIIGASPFFGGYASGYSTGYASRYGYSSYYSSAYPFGWGWGMGRWGW